jgi:tetratricopeptide (TPR) repeat protein
MRIKEVGVLLWVVFCLGLLSGLSQSNPSRQQQIESHDRQATEYLKENRPDLAVPEFRAIVALDPNNVEGRGNLGTMLFFQGDYTNAIPQLRAALKLQPTLWKTEALLGMAEKRTGDISRARGDLETAFPNVLEEKIRIETGMELIEIDSRTGDLDKAAAIVSELRKLEPTDQAILYTAYRIYSDLADESLLSLSVVDPNSARMQQAMAHELAKRGNIAGAIEHYRAALKIDSRLPGIHFELAEMLHTMSNAESRQEAENEYRTALQVNPLDEQSECRLADMALEGNDLQEAKERYTRALQSQPNDPEASLGLAKVYMAMDQPKQAEPLLQRAIKLDPTNAVAHYRLARLYRETGRPDDAVHEIALFQKYQEMKEKLRGIYHDFRAGPEDETESETASPKPQ